MKPFQEKILIDLDCLFDTRAPLLLDVIGESRFDELVKKNLYHGRYSDNFTTLRKKPISQDEQESFEARYKNRKLSEMKGSFFMTNFMYALIQHGYTVFRENKLTHEPQDLNVYINIFPHVLIDEEKEMLINTMRDVLTDVKEVKIISLSKEWLTPDCLSAYTQYVCYDFADLLECQKDALLEKPIPTFMVSAPVKQVTDGKPSVELLLNGATEMSMRLAPYIGFTPLTMADLSFFRGK